MVVWLTRREVLWQELKKAIEARSYKMPKLESNKRSEKPQRNEEVNDQEQNNGEAPSDQD